MLLGTTATASIGAYWFGITKIILLLAYYSVGILFYTHVEGWDVLECVYFSTVTASTVGYGCVHPTTDDSRVFTSFYMLYGIIGILPMANDFAENIGHRVQNEILLTVKSMAHGNPWILQNVSKGVISIVAIFIVYYVGIAFYTSNEDFTFATAIYFTTQTMTTVGFGDLCISQDSSRVFGIFFIICSVLTMATALNEFGIIYGSFMHVRRRNQLLNEMVKGDGLRHLAGGGGGVSKHMFVLEILIELGVVDREADIEPLMQRFEELDQKGSGVLEVEDIDRFVAQERSRARSLTPTGEMQARGRATDQSSAVDNPLVATQYKKVAQLPAGLEYEDEESSAH